MNEQEQTLRRPANPKPAVCAHIGFGADDTATQAARKRLAGALENYRPIATRPEPSESN